MCPAPNSLFAELTGERRRSWSFIGGEDRLTPASGGKRHTFDPQVAARLHLKA